MQGAGSTKFEGGKISKIKAISGPPNYVSSSANRSSGCSDAAMDYIFLSSLHFAELNASCMREMKRIILHTYL